MRTYLRTAAIIFYKGKLITTKMKKDGKTYYVLPGGGVEGNETIFDALKREVDEEVNLKVKKLKLVYIKELNLKIEGGGRGVEFYFFVEEYEGVPTKGFDPEEKDSSLEGLGFINIDDLKNTTFHPEQLVKFLEKDNENGFDKVRHLGLHDYP
ncbi:MAG: hypothetical protein CVU81_03100 [Euryarchaeota archaeon HGW-Euryarchaeota-1]|nr:MAG: hypothetical protein CVU81_03100 [Euryarchaeota archaeon HGW-Euryarchaeota-1]